MPSDPDIGQVLIIAIAMIAAFVQWVWKLVQDSKAARERARPQRGKTPALDVEPEAVKPPPMPAPRGGVWELVDAFKEEMRKSQAGLEPAETPDPRSPSPGHRRVVVPPPPLPPVTTQKPVEQTPETIIPTSIPAFETTPTSRDDSVVLRMNLMNLDALKQAIILREILGPPKAMQAPSDSF